MRAKLIMFSIMTACTLGSCESILEIDPISEITMANYWKSESDVKGYLNGLYSDYRGMTYPVWRRSWRCYGIGSDWRCFTFASA